MKRYRMIAVLFMLAILGGQAFAKDVFICVPLGDLTITQGTLSREDRRAFFLWRLSDQPQVTLDGGGEAFIILPSVPSMRSGVDESNPPVFRLAARVPEGKPISGRIFFPKHDNEPANVVRFEIKDASPAADAEVQFQRACEFYYKRLAASGIPGTAWFRHKAAEAHQDRVRLKDTDTTQAREMQEMEMMFMRPGQGANDLQATYQLFSGGRAVSENLRLDRELQVRDRNELMQSLAGVKGITIRPYAWDAVSTGPAAALDPLAKAIPADQHALFFPSFQAMTAVMDEADRNGTPILDLLEARSEDARTRERYQRQLCLSTDALSRMLGPKLVKSVAFTGSDPYLRTGSDVAVLFEPVDPAALMTLITARQAAGAQADPAAKPANGEINGVRYAAFRSPDRSVCSYLASAGGVVIVSNSPYQLGQIIKTIQGKNQPLASAKEYQFFRTRYIRGQADESALLVLSDDTIRRWCGPVWRIGNSRRVRIASAMAELQARHIDGSKLPADSLDPGDLTWSASGPNSTKYGTLTFQTPIAELNITSATQTEISAYENFREAYEHEWSRFFDPIAIRFGVAPDRLSADLTVMPLVLGSDYREFTQLTRGAKIKKNAGDPHPEALLHVVMALNPKSELLDQAGGLLLRGTGSQLTNPLGWLGQSVAIYADADPFWQDVNNADQMAIYFHENRNRLPIAVTAEVVDPLKLTAFLSAFFGYADQSAPDLLTRITHKYKGKSYIEIREQDVSTSATMSVYYAATPKALTVTPNEALVKRALDRQVTKNANRNTTGTWLGESLAVNARSGALDVAKAIFSNPYQETMRERAWANIIILNEWHRRFPNESPVGVHERLWGVRLVDPAGGQYTWNEEAHTMQSSVYGYPGEAKKGPEAPAALKDARDLAMGLTFENDGLRARAALTRAPAGGAR